MIRRRLYTEVRVSRLATLARRIAVFSLPVIVLAVALHRFGLLEYEVAVITLSAGVVVALIAVLVAIAAFVVIWNEGLRGLGRAIAAALIGAAVLAWPAFEFVRSASLPSISDITTDPSDPPRFFAVASARPSGANPVNYPGERVAELQRAAYPGVQAYEVDASADEVFNIALAVVQKRGWRVLDSVTPRGGQREGRIEAVALTFLMGFREDVVIRIRSTGGLVRIDMRSASRYGNHDLGSNARRIENFFAEFTLARRQR
ncbi:MAG: DUF1499 domain-containing protein [Bradyrhizobiaceae bacterium]|nr:DUF1499 domain-containing protein [Bradyrhizobiaceae bacterium]